MSSFTGQLMSLLLHYSRRCIFFIGDHHTDRAPFSLGCLSCHQRNERAAGNSSRNSIPICQWIDLSVRGHGGGSFYKRVFAEKDCSIAVFSLEPISLKMHHYTFVHVLAILWPARQQNARESPHHLRHSWHCQRGQLATTPLTRYY